MELDTRREEWMIDARERLEKEIWRKKCGTAGGRLKQQDKSERERDKDLQRGRFIG